MPNDEVIGPRKTMFVLVIVVGCFAVLWPRILSPLVLGPSREQMQPNQFDREAGCCEVIFETDVAVLELVNEVCSSALGVGRLSPQSAAECRKAVNDTCGLDIAVFLKRNENVGKTTKMLVETMQNSNSSCLREHFGVPVYSLGPHLASKTWDIKDTLKQERAPPMRGMGPHPALRERGRAIPPGPPGPPPMPASKPMALPPHVRPPPIPGMRPPLGSPGGPVPAPKSSMGFVMPIYTICIIVFFVYTLSKILFRRTASPYDTITPDPQFRRRVFRDDSRSSPDKLGKKEADTIVTAISGLVAEVQQQMEASDAQNQQRQEVQDNARPYTNGTILLNTGPVQIVASEYKDGKDKLSEPVNEKEPTSEPKGTEPIKVAKESSPEQDIVPECKEPTIESKESSEVIKSSPEPLDQQEATHASVVKESSPEPALTKQTDPSPEPEPKEPTPELISSAETALKSEENIQPVIESVTTSDSDASSPSPVYSTSEIKAVKESSPEPTSQLITQTSTDKVNEANEAQQITEPTQLISESSEVNDPLAESQEPSMEPKESSPELKVSSPKPKESSPEPKESSPKSKESSPEPKELSPALKETSPVAKKPSPELKESTPEPKEPSPEPKESTPEPKEPSPELKESAQEPKESLPEPKEPSPEPKQSSPESNEPTPELTSQPEETIPESSQVSEELVQSESKTESSLESDDSKVNLLDTTKALPKEPIPDPDIQESSTDLEVVTPEHTSPILDSNDLNIEHKAPSHKESTLDLTESQELDAPVERSPEPNLDTGLKEPTSQSKEPTPEPKETNESKPEVENSIAEGTLLDLDEAIAELDDATSNLQEESGAQNQDTIIPGNLDDVDVELMKVFGSGTKDDDNKNESDNFLINERFTVTKRTTPEHIEDMVGRTVEMLTPTETPAAFKHEAEEVKSIFLETEIPQQSRVLVAQFEEDRAPDTSDKPRPAKHAPLVVSGKMTLSLIQDAPRETPERDPESTVDEFTTASAVTQPAAEKGELESDEEVDEEIEVEEIEEIEEIEEEEEEEEEEPPSPVKTVRK